MALSRSVETAVMALKLTYIGGCFLIVSVMFLVSFALAMASPKKMSLHDFVAQTIVVSNDSIIFDTSVDERAYEQEEDGVVSEPSTGEEPELSYEK